MTAKTIDEMSALRRLALEDLDSTPDGELRAEALEDGRDVDDDAATMRASMREAMGGALRERMSRARRTTQPGGLSAIAATVRPSLDKIKAMVNRAFELDPSLRMAFRDGKRQSDSDFQSLYDDLVKLGKIGPFGDAD